MFNLRNFKIILQSGCSVLLSYHQYLSVPVVPHLHKHLVLSVFHFSHSTGNEMVSHGFEFL